MKKLLALFMAFLLTFQLVTPVFAEEIEETQAATEAVEVETEAPVTEVPTTEPPVPETAAPEETSAPTEPQPTTEVTEATASTEETIVTTEPTEETTEPALDLFAEDGNVIASGECGESLSWTLNDSGTLTISGKGKMEDYSYSNEAPWKKYSNSVLSLIINDGVTTIGQYAFSDLDKMQNVYIPSSVTWMKDRAFGYCEALRTIYIPETLTQITMKDSDHAPFYGCSERLCVFCGISSMPDSWGITWANRASGYYTGRGRINDYYGITKDEYYALHNLDKTGKIITVPDNITIIPAYYFAELDKVKEIRLPETLEEIDLCAFFKCTGLDTLYIPKSVTTIVGYSEKYSPFIGCRKDLKLYCGADKSQPEWDRYWNYCSYGSLTTFFGMSASDMSYWSTLNCTAAYIAIPDGIECIPEKAFANQIGLQEITIPASVKVIRQHAFDKCTGLRRVKIAEGVAKLGYGAFSGCTSLEEIVLPNSIGQIDGNCFSGCSSLKSVMLPEKLSELTSCVFLECTELNEIDLRNITSIGSGAFAGCTGMSSFYIPATVTTIQGSPFLECNTKMQVYCGAAKQPKDWDSKWNCTNSYSFSNTLKAFYSVSKNAYDYWAHISPEETNLVIPNTVDSIPDWIGQNTPKAATLYIPSSVKYIGEYAFASNNALVSVTIEPGVQTIGCNAFWGCNITSINLPNTLISMGDGAFLSCKKLKDARVPGSLKKVPNKAFENCTSLRNVILEDGIAELGYELFANCNNISRLVIPASVQKIGYGLVDRGGSTRLEYKGTMLQWAEMGVVQPAYCSDGYLIDSSTCGDLNVNIGERVKWYITSAGNGYSLTIFGDGAMRDWPDADDVPWAEYRNDIVEVTIVEGVTKIGECAFWGCVNMKKIALPESLEWINQYAFSWCHSLKTIAIPKNVDTIGTQAFWDCYNLTSINFLHDQNDALSIYEEAFITQSKQVSTKIRVPDVNQVNAAIDSYPWKNDHRTISYGYNDCLPKVEKIVLWQDGKAMQETQTIDLYDERTTLDFCAEVQPEGALTQVTWSSNNPKVASVATDGTVTLLKPGTAVIKAMAADGSKVTAQVTLNVIYTDHSPKLGVSALNLNTAYSLGTTVDFVERLGNRVETVSVSDDRFDVSYENNRLTLKAQEPGLKGTYKLTLEAVCADGRTYSYPLAVKAAPTLPRLTVKQTEKFNLFCRDSEVALTITGGEVEEAELISSNFVLDNKEGQWVIRYADPENAPAKPNTKAILSVTFAGYSMPVTKTLTISAVNTAPKLTLNPTSSILNTTLVEDLEVETELVGTEEDNLSAWAEPSSVDVSLTDGVLSISLNESKTVTASIYVQDDNWVKPVKLTHRITVTDKKPTVKLSAKGKLDVLNPASEIIYTPKLSNATGTITDVRLDGQDANLFNAEVVDGLVHLKLAKSGENYATKKTYKVTPVVILLGEEITGSTLSVKVTQSAMKLAKLPNRTVYQSQTAPLAVKLTVTSPANAKIGNVQLNAKTTAALQNALEAAGGIQADKATVSFPAKAFAALKPGRYTVILDVTPANAASDTKPTQAKFTLAVQK